MTGDVEVNVRLKDKVDFYLMTHQEYFPAEKLPFLRDKLLQLPEEKMNYLSYVELQKPTVNLIISLLLGSLGIDRFMIGDIGLGVLKLLTLGCCGVMNIIDWFLIMGKTKEKNFDKVWQALQF